MRKICGAPGIPPLGRHSPGSRGPQFAQQCDEGRHYCMRAAFPGRRCLLADSSRCRVSSCVCAPMFRLTARRGCSWLLAECTGARYVSDLHEPVVHDAAGPALSAGPHRGALARSPCCAARRRHDAFSSNGDGRGRCRGEVRVSVLQVRTRGLAPHPPRSLSHTHELHHTAHVHVPTHLPRTRARAGPYTGPYSYLAACNYDGAGAVLNHMCVPGGSA